MQLTQSVAIEIRTLTDQMLGKDWTHLENRYNDIIQEASSHTTRHL